MLQNIGEHIRGWVAGVITVIIALTFVFWGIQYEHSGSSQNPALVKVDGKSITEQDLNAAYQQWKTAEEHRLKQHLTVLQQQQLKAMALQQLVNNSVLYQTASQQGFIVSIDQIKQMLMAEPEFQENGRFSVQRFQQVLLANGITPERFFQQMQQAFTIRQVADGILLSAFVLRDEMSKIYSLVAQKRSFNYFILPLSKINSKKTPTQQEIDHYYREHKKAFNTPERVKVSYILLSPDRIAETITLNPTQVKQYYNRHLDEFTHPQQWQIDALVVKMPATASNEAYEQAKQSLEALHAKWQQDKTISWEDLAKKTPNTELLSQQWVNADQMSDSMRQTLFKLKPGEVSAPVYMKTGLAIVRIISSKPAEIQDFETARPVVEAAFKHQQVQKILNQQSEKLSEYTYTNPSTLSVAAQSLNLPIQTSPWLTRAGEKQGLFSNQKLLATIFSSDILQQGDNSEPIELSDGSLIVVRVNAHHLSETQPLEAVKPQIVQALQQQDIANQAGLEAFEIQNALLTGVSPEEIEKKYGLVWQKQQDMSRDSKTTLSKSILREAFNLMPSSQQAHPVTTTLLPNGDYAIIQLGAVTLADYKHAPVNDVDQLHSTLSNYWGQTNYQLYMQAAVANSKVKYAKQPE